MVDGRINYQSEIPDERVEAYKKQEAARQDLMAGRDTPGAHAYARFLSFCAFDATIIKGVRPPTQSATIEEHLLYGGYPVHENYRRKK